MINVCRFSLICENIRCRRRARVVLPLDEGPEIPITVTGFFGRALALTSASASVILRFEAASASFLFFVFSGCF
jgi:hypothetical protein